MMGAQGIKVPRNARWNCEEGVDTTALKKWP